MLFEGVWFCVSCGIVVNVVFYVVFMFFCFMVDSVIGFGLMWFDLLLFGMFYFVFVMCSFLYNFVIVGVLIEVLRGGIGGLVLLIMVVIVVLLIGYLLFMGCKIE